MSGVQNAEDTNLLLSNHPLETKLFKTISAFSFVMFDFNVFTSLRAANEDTEYDSWGPSIICST